MLTHAAAAVLPSKARWPSSDQRRAPQVAVRLNPADAAPAASEELMADCGTSPTAAGQAATVGCMGLLRRPAIARDGICLSAFRRSVRSAAAAAAAAVWNAASGVVLILRSCRGGPRLPADGGLR